MENVCKKEKIVRDEIRNENNKRDDAYRFLRWFLQLLAIIIGGIAIGFCLGLLNSHHYNKPIELKLDCEDVFTPPTLPIAGSTA